MRLVSVTDCVLPGGDTIECGDYLATFSLDNGMSEALSRIEQIEIEIGGAKLRTGYKPCTGSPWTLDATDSSGVIELSITTSGVGGTPEAPEQVFRPEITYRCGYSKNVTEPLRAPGPIPHGGDALLRLSGLMRDASGWSAAASTDVVDMAR